MAGILRAGFGRADITPKLGCKLVGYGGREQGATAVHDPLYARALVVEDAAGVWAIVSCDLCYLFAETVAEIRASVQQQTSIPREHIFIATTHTHAGPHDRHVQNWDRPLAEIVANAVVQAHAQRRPARIGAGYSFLYGHSINRRWLDKPVDPGLMVVRVDDEQGKLLGLVSVFGCHAVVLGYDNLQISGDWPGYAMAKLEQELGPGITCLFFQGGAGDINPLVEGVRRRLRRGEPVRAIGKVSTYYGQPDRPNEWNIGDRGGGTFAEVAELGEAYAGEVAYVARTIPTGIPDLPFWSEQVVINAAAEPGEHPVRPPAPIAGDIIAAMDDQHIWTELMLLGLGEVVLVGQPGEVFSETAVNVRMRLRHMGYRAPMLVSYANGWFLYLPEASAFVEGGYEPNWAATLNISRRFQERAWAAIEPVLRRRLPQPQPAR
ncbi:MAG TPA: neutral/alkaline non-lysosomal ceramidase N-terminal domain-containing protein [Caldilineaceae bacterium]|nr:neutral/alkaline non-lysosomal ceramidase N-terminal domain-containing protein [Caldilineaceae bacterium]